MSFQPTEPFQHGASDQAGGEVSSHKNTNAFLQTSQVATVPTGTLSVYLLPGMLDASCGTEGKMTTYVDGEKRVHADGGFGLTKVNLHLIEVDKK